MDTLFIHYPEVVFFGAKNVLPLYRLVHQKVSFIQRCPLFRGVLYSECPLSEVHCAAP